VFAIHWDVKITVLERLLLDGSVLKYREGDWNPCNRLEDGQEFIVSGSTIDLPPGFCSWAWADLQKYVVTLARGGNFLGSKPGKTVAACTDGYRPVIFGLERVEPGDE
jgi:uncharacterized repeat protein (TIGR04076 family)